MESNGVGRLFTYARELAVGAMRAGGEAVRNEPAEKVLPKQPPTASGVRLSLLLAGDTTIHWMLKM